MNTSRLLATTLMASLLAACTTTPVPPSSGGHIGADSLPETTVRKSEIPAPVQTTVAIPKPKPSPKVETYSVVVNNIPVQDLLFALARDAKINVDIHPGIVGNVTLNAIDQTLQQLLTRIAKQVDMRWEMDGANLAVMPDAPFLRTYKVDYVNVSREVASTIASNNRVSSGTGTGTGAAVASGNLSTTKIDNVVKNHFWATLEQNIKDLLRETDKVLPEGSSETVIEKTDQQATTGTGVTSATGSRGGSGGQAGIATSPNPATLQQAGTTVVRRTTFREASSVIINPESGILTVRATARQQEKVQEYLTSVLTSARRQVLIEATIAEVTLNDAYNQGIEWERLRADGSGFSIKRTTEDATSTTPVTPFTIKYNKSSSLPLSVTLQLLETFGNVKVLSSPKLSVMNNQTAILRVVEDFVYFKVDSSIAAGNTNTNALQSVTTTPQTVSVGLTLAVTPQISDSDVIILNVRPTITSVAKLVQDPNPQLPDNISNYVPQLRTREIESVMRVDSGDIAVLGGLMEDSIDYNTNRVPIVGRIPILGEIFTNRANSARKTELVVFLRPVVLKAANLDGDFADYREQLPGKNFFTTEQSRHQPLPSVAPGSEGR